MNSEPAARGQSFASADITLLDDGIVDTLYLRIAATPIPRCHGHPAHDGRILALRRSAIEGVGEMGIVGVAAAIVNAVVPTLPSGRSEIVAA